MIVCEVSLPLSDPSRIVWGIKTEPDCLDLSPRKREVPGLKAESVAISGIPSREFPGAFFSLLTGHFPYRRGFGSKRRDPGLRGVWTLVLFLVSIQVLQRGTLRTAPSALRTQLACSTVLSSTLEIVLLLLNPSFIHV